MNRARHVTCNCESGEHHACDGYIAPLVYSNTRPCSCACHDGIFGRNFQRAMRRAERSYYGRERVRVFVQKGNPE